MNNLEAIIAKLELELTAINSAILALRSISGTGSAPSVQPTGQKRRGRPPKNPNAALAPTTSKATAKGITEEGRLRLAESMRKRWAAKKAIEKKANRAKTAK